MNKTFKKLALCAVALLFAQTISAGVKTTYNFVLAPDATPVQPTWGDEVVVHGNISLNLLAYGDKTFDNHFAVGPTERNVADGTGFRFRTSGAYKGLWSADDGRYFSILDLKAGDKVTFTMHTTECNLSFVDGDAVVSGQEYIAEADGTMDFVSKGKVWIENVTIETKGLAITIGIIPGADPTVYDFVQAEEGAQAAPTYGSEVTTGGNTLQLISYGGNDFDNKFAVGPTIRNNGTNNGFIFRTAGDWKGLWSNWNNRNFSILNLKKGETVTLIISQNATSLSFVGGDAVVSGQSYTVETDGNLDFVTNANGTYIESVSILPAGAAGTSAGATLVTPVALDFTNSTIKAYIATEANAGTVSFKQVYKVPANTALLLKAENTTVLNEIVNELDGDAEDVSENLLQGNTTNVVLESNDDTRYYVYGTHNKKAAFYYASAINCQAGLAYLALTAEQAGAASRLNFAFGGSATAVKTTGAVVAKTNEVYTLSGQRAGKATQKGIYVVNGRKVVIK